MRIQTVFFDLDGTLWPPNRVALPSFQRVLEQLGQPVPDDDILLATLGYPTVMIWEKLLPNATNEMRAAANRLMVKTEIELLQQGRVQPYPGVRETLEKLATAGMSLCILSNCERAYLQAVPDALGIGHYFGKRFCAGDFPGLSKSQILGRLLPHFSPPAAMVGDRWHDVEAGKDNHLLTIGCTYGLGKEEELTKADYRITRFHHLQQILL